MEEWRRIPSVDGYEASSDGRIRNERGLRKPQPMNRGYLSIKVRSQGAHFTRTVHSLVAEAFYGSRPEGEQVNHKDGDKTNNRPNNLEWVTASANMRHAVNLGLRRAATGTARRKGGAMVPQAGASNYNAKLTTEQATDALVRLRAGERAKDVAARYGVSKSLISKLSVGARWPELQ